MELSVPETKLGVRFDLAPFLWSKTHGGEGEKVLGGY